MKRALLLASAIFATAFGATASQAGLLDNSINAYYNFPSYGSSYGGFSMSPDATFTVGAGSEGTAYVDGYPIDVDFSDDQLVLTLPTISFNGTSFNGIVFSNLSGTFSAIQSSSGASASLDGNSILAINWQGLSYGAGDKVIVNFGGTPAVPEPASWALMIVGIGAVGVAMRRRSAAVSFA